MHSKDKSFKEKNQDVNKFPKAIAHGKIAIGNIEIDCAVLENGTQVIIQKSILKLMGRSHPGGRPSKEIQSLREAGVQIPIFVAANNLTPFIPRTLCSQGTPIIFKSLGGGPAHGYDAKIIPDICDTYINARRQGNILTKDQIPIAATLEIVNQGLSRLGITALINEACGIVSNEKDYLQKILNEYIEKILQPWVKRFPQSFFSRYKKMYGLSDNNKIPIHIGHFINTFIYKEQTPGMLDELKKLNPVNDNGRRSHAHHQFLTPNKGVVALEKQVLQINSLMGIAKNKKQFIEFYEQVKE